MGKFADELAPKFADSTEPTLADWREDTIAWFIERKIIDSRKPGARELGPSHYLNLRRLQRYAIGKVKAETLNKNHLIDLGRARKADGVKPATTNQDITFLRGVIRDYVDNEELPESALMAFTKSQRKMRHEQLVGKSQPRDRLPETIELELLLDYFAKQNEHPKTEIDMVLVVWGELFLGRRISELCRLERQHVNVEKKTYWVYDLKNSKGKGYHGEAALIEGGWEFVEQRLAQIPNEPTARLFPFNAHCCSQRYSIAKNKLRETYPDLFKDLRMHDNRAEACVRLLRKGYSPLQITKGFSLHSDTKMLETRYGRLKALDMHKGPVGPRAAP